MKINRKQTIKQVIDSLKFEYQYINPDVRVPNQGAEEIKSIDIEFFNLGKYATNQEVIDEYQKRGLEPDVFAVIQYLKENPKELEEKKWIAVKLGREDYLTFNRDFFDERHVNCNRINSFWDGGWWFTGVRKSLDTRELGTSWSRILGHLDKVELEIKEIRKLCEK